MFAFSHCQNSGASGNQVAPFQTASSSGGDGAGASSSPRSSAEYQAAVELELWKENQEKEFERQVGSLLFEIPHGCCEM